MRIACVQADVDFGDPVANSHRAVVELERLAGQGVDLAVFPEAFLTGYCVDDAGAASHIAITASLGEPDDPLAMIGAVCDQFAIHAIVGFAEAAGNSVLHNSAMFFMPGRDPVLYRKSHLPELGLDKHVVPGSELPVFDTELGKIGTLICFDLRVPEASRVLALKGAELIVLPTNWPEGAETSAEHVAIARVAENRVFMATCNRVGEENGFRFIGRSKIVHPSGKVIAAAGTGEETIVADIDLAEARIKRNVMIPGKYETDVIGSRRPELYGEIGIRR